MRHYDIGCVIFCLLSVQSRASVFAAGFLILFPGSLQCGFGYATTHLPNLNLLTLEEDLLQMHWRLARVTVENLDWKDCVRRYDRRHTLFYLDPPYYGTKDFRYNLEEEDFAALAAVLGSIKAKFLLSLGDHPVMRKLFTSFKCAALTTKYSTMKKKKARAEPKQELLITNF